MTESEDTLPEGGGGAPVLLPDFQSLAGSLAVREAKRNAAWDEVVRETRSARAAKRR